MKERSFIFRLYSAACVLVVAVSWTGNILAQDPLESREPILITQSPRQERPATQNGREVMNPLLPAVGSRIVRLTGSSVKNLTPGFESAAHPCLSPNATEFLYVARKEQSQRFRVWQMSIDGHEDREVVHCDGDCAQPIWLSTLYTLDDAAPAPRIAFVCVPTNGGVPAIFTCRPDGVQVRQITFHPWGAVDPVALPDGRLAFRTPTAVAASDDKESKFESAQWFAIHVDGTDLTAFQPFGRLNSEEFSSLSHTLGVSRGGMGSLNQNRFSDGRTVLSRTMDSTASKGLVAEQPADVRVDVLYDSPDWDEIDSVVITPRSMLPGHSSTVRDSAKAEIYCLDVGINDGTKGISQNARTVRFASAGNGAAGASEHTLGIAEIEDDGSFFVEVPASTPIRMELLDRHGGILRSMNNWTWVMPGERRGCIGCHEDPLLSPPNKHVLALRKPAQKLRGPEDNGSVPILENSDRERPRP